MSLAPGRSLNQRFTLIRPLGHGGTAQVWLVRDEDLDEQVVAKVVPSGASNEHVALLRRECRQLRRLLHPNIVRVYDFHRGDGFDFLTMAYIEGEELGRFRGRPPAEILRVLLPVAEALDYAHGSGIVHRDIKPGNILCDAAGRPHLLDFGIAGLMETKAGDAALVGGGSPHNRSPEQLGGQEPHRADDIYGFGVLLHELITGRPPFWPDVSDERVRTEAPEPLRSAYPLPEALSSLVAGMLAKSASDRPPDMAVVKARLEEIAAGLVDSAAPPAGATEPPRLEPPPRARPIKPVPPLPIADPARGAASRRRRRNGAALNVAIVLGVAGILYGVFFFLPRLAERLRGTAEEAEAAPVVATTNRPEEVAPPEAPGRRDLRDQAASRRRAEDAMGRAGSLMEDLDVRGAALWSPESFEQAGSDLSAGDEHLTSGEHDQAAEAYERAIRELEAVDGHSVEVLGEALDEGRAALEAGDPNGALAAFRLATRIAPANATAAIGRKRAEVLGQVLELLDAGVEQERAGNLERAEESYRRAATLDPLSPEAGQALARVRGRIGDDAFARQMSQGFAALAQGEYAAARESFEKAGAMKPGSAQVADGLAQVENAQKIEAIARHQERARELVSLERFKEAAEQYEAVLRLDSNVSFARQGRDRCLMRAALVDRIAYHLAHPARLSADDVLMEATGLLDEASRIHPAGPLHRQQVEQLEHLIRVAGTPMRVHLESDDQTEVTIYKVGRLGTFTQHELELRPGVYTVVGSRQGYRDVRRQLVVEAGKVPETLVVRCEDEI